MRWIASSLALTTATAASAPSDWTAIDAQARFLAGTSTSALPAFESSPAWRVHVEAMDKMWARVSAARLRPMGTFARAEVDPRINTTLPLVYFFGGPDVATADVAYPEAPVMVLMGLERLGSLPDDFASLTPAQLEAALTSLRATVSALSGRGYFITQVMGKAMLRSPLRGVLPVLLALLARAGEHVLSALPIAIDDDGAAGIAASVESAIGWRLRIQRDDGAAARELIYLKADLSDAALKRTPGLLSFLRALGEVNAFLKAASFILHDDRFSLVREYLLANSASVLQDDSGIPFQFFARGGWRLTYFGGYSPPAKVFAKYRQPEMEKTWQSAAPLNFETGYPHTRPGSHLLLAVRDQAPATLTATTQDQPAPDAGSP